MDVCRIDPHFRPATLCMSFTSSALQIAFCTSIGCQTLVHLVAAVRALHLYTLWSSRCFDGLLHRLWTSLNFVRSLISSLWCWGHGKGACHHIPWKITYGQVMLSPKHLSSCFLDLSVWKTAMFEVLCLWYLILTDPIQKNFQKNIQPQPLNTFDMPLLLVSFDVLCFSLLSPSLSPCLSVALRQWGERHVQKRISWGTSLRGWQKPRPGNDTTCKITCKIATSAKLWTAPETKINKGVHGVPCCQYVCLVISIGQIYILILQNLMRQTCVTCERGIKCKSKTTTELQERRPRELNRWCVWCVETRMTKAGDAGWTLSWGEIKKGDWLRKRPWITPACCQPEHPKSSTL